MKHRKFFNRKKKREKKREKTSAALETIITHMHVVFDRTGIHKKSSILQPKQDKITQEL